VVELDFVSMYPSIMARFNVSPETVGCACCRNARVPEIGYSLCERRQGLVSRALAPIIEKRARYKALRRAAAEAGDEAAHRRFDDRQSALKWMLVCCFGYLGYRNARFGRIEAHEAVSAFARELLLVARETCEARGWRVLHANVDSVWIAKPGFAREEIAPLCEAIGTVTGLDIALEGIYRWIAFLPSREFADRPVPTRFFGVFDGGSLKFRGIECRRRDLPVWIREAQARVLAILAAAPDRAGYEALIPQVREEIDALEGALRRREVALDQLVIRQRLSREPAEYHGPGAQALAARQAVRAGLRLHAGQLMSYLLTDMENADRERRVCLAALADATTTYDPAAYIRLLRRAMNTLLWPVGVALDETLRAPSTRRRGRPRRTRPRRAGKQLDWLPGERPPMRVG
jgi:DNA polymerase elongation subunit (family B)